MSALLDVLAPPLGGETLRLLAGRVRAGEEGAYRAMTAAVPILVGALASRANSSALSARALSEALDRDHDGTLLDHVDAIMGEANGTPPADVPAAIAGRTLDGAGILDHLLGERRGAVEAGLGRATGLDVAEVAGLLEALAPLVMAGLGRARRDRGLDHDKVASLLNRERAEMERSVPPETRPRLLDFLDGDDEQVTDEVAEIAKAVNDSEMIRRAFLPTPPR